MPINMSHCRNRNTLLALQEAYDELDTTADKSEEERRSRDSLLLLCKRIADDFECEIEQITIQRQRERAQKRPAAA